MAATFAHQNELPSLPLPSLVDTVQRYVKSLSAILSQDELENVIIESNKFIESQDGHHLQEFLEKRQTRERNWLEEWWYDAYNLNRDSLLKQNMGSINPRARKGDQLSNAAQFVYHTMSYWTLIRQQKVDVVTSRGVKWDMQQFYNLFNSSRRPAAPKDVLKRYFKLEAEGDCPSHVMIFCKGHIWKLETHVNGRLLSISDIYSNLKHISDSSTKSNENSVLTLTTLERDAWSEIRAFLAADSSTNRDNLETIETSVFCMTIAEDIVEDESALMKYSLFGVSRNAYCDKSLNVIVMKDGQICQQAEHCNVDAISLFSPCDYSGKQLSADFKPTMSEHLHVTPLHFQLTNQIRGQVHNAENAFKKLCDQIDLRVYQFNDYGNLYCKTKKLYADTIIQIALQIAYYTTHRKLAPTYETASTRKFFHGRTETVRSLTPAIAKLIKSIENGATTEALQTLFYDAYNSHNDLMDAAKDGQGIDRHFLGLKNAQHALESEGQTIANPLIDHPAFEKSGGNGKFKLSTSFLGYDEDGSFGYVTAMCSDGYGCFYKICNNQFVFTITTYVDDESTTISGFVENLKKSLMFIKDVIIQ